MTEEQGFQLIRGTALGLVILGLVLLLPVRDPVVNAGSAASR